MKSHLHNFFSFLASNALPPEGHARIAILKSRKSILKVLRYGLETGNVVGVYCPAFGDGLFLVGIEDITSVHGEEVISFHKYDLNGSQLHRTQVAISEIKSVCPFESRYENPVLKATVAIA